MKGYFKIIMKIIKVKFLSCYEYRIDFFTGLMSSLVVQITNILFLFIIFSKIPKLNGWSIYETALLSFSVSLAIDFYKLIFSGLNYFPDYYVKRGHFDIILLKPINELLFIILEGMLFTKLSGIIVDLIILCIGVNRAGYGVVEFLILIFSSFIGSLVMGALLIIFCYISFFTTEVFGAIKMITSICEFSKYPASIYPKAINNLFTFILPLFIVGFIPVEFFKKGDITIFIIPFLVSVLIIVLSLILWKKGLKKYQSTGS